jgi:hypothetical protein
VTGPRLSDEDLVALHRQYQAQHAAPRPPAAGRLRVPDAARAPSDATPDLAALYRQYRAQQDHETPGEFAAGAARAVGQGVTFGFGDEAEAAVRAPFSDRTYPELRDEIRASNRTFGQRHEILAPALEAGGALATAAIPLGGAARGLTAAARIGRAAKVGAVTGAVYGFGKGEGSAGSQALSTAQGAALGAVGGTALQGAGEVGRSVAQATSASPRLANAVASAVPLPRLRQWAAGVQGRAEDAINAGRLMQDGGIDQAMTVLRDAPQSIPVAVADAGGENTRQQFAALKRMEGRQKQQIAKTVASREENAPVWMQRSIRQHTENDAPALGIPAEANVDTRTTNPNAVAKAAREALSARSDARYAPAMARPGLEQPDALARFGELLQRPSMRRALRSGESLAAESGEPITLRTLTEAPPVFDEAGNVAVPARTLPGRAASEPPMTATRTIGEAAAEKPVARPGSKLATRLGDAARGEDVAPPSGAAEQARFYGALDDAALSRQWQRETERMAAEDARVVEGQWTRETSAGVVQSGGSRTSGAGKVQGANARARLARVEEELKRRGYDDDAIFAQWSEGKLPPRPAAGAPAETVDAADMLREPAAPPAPASARVPAPSVRQLHYIKMGLDEQINTLEAREATLRTAGQKGGATSAKLRTLRATKRELLRVIDDVAPEYAGAMRAHAAEAAPIGAFQQGRRLAPGTDAEEVATRLADLPNDDARTGMGAGYARNLRRTLRTSADAKADPVKAILGSATESGNKTQNLRLLLPKAAPGIEQDAETVTRIRATNAAVAKNSATAERVAEDAGTAKKIGAVASLLAGKPVAFVRDVFGGTYGKVAEGAAQKLLLGAQPGERQAALDYLASLQRRAAPTGGIPRLRTRAVGTLAGQAGGSTAAAVTRRP